MTGKPTIWTYDRVPAGPRGFVRDLRLRATRREPGRARAVEARNGWPYRTVPLR